MQLSKHPVKLQAHMKASLDALGGAGCPFSATDPHWLRKVQDERLSPPLFLPSKQVLLFWLFSDFSLSLKCKASSSL